MVSELFLGYTTEDRILAFESEQFRKKISQVAKVERTNSRSCVCVCEISSELSESILRKRAWKLRGTEVQ